MFRNPGPTVVGLLVWNASICLGATPVEPPPAEKPQVYEVDQLPRLDANKKPIRTIDADGFRFEVDLSPQVVEIMASEPRDSWRGDVNQVRVGDTVEIAVDDASLLLGDTVVAKLPKRRRLVISEVNGDWLATTVLVDNVAKTGWLARGKVHLVGDEESIAPTLPGAAREKFISASMLLQKAKQFDDGLYAAVELAAQNGAGDMAGKKVWLKSLIDDLAADNPTEASTVVAAAGRLGGQELTLPRALDAAVRSQIESFNGDALRSKPVGFYTWNGQLSSIFRQDRMLQSELTAASGVGPLAQSLKENAAVRDAYERYLRLVAKLTNPWEKQDLRPLLQSARSIEVDETFHFFPPSISHETTLAKQLYGEHPVPPGFNLMDELVARIRTGKLSLVPRVNSGWYDYQTFALETLAKPEAGYEASKLKLNDEYEKLLVELLKGAWALARETHIKQLEIAPTAAAGPPSVDPPMRKKVYLQLELSAEPLATHYRRRADAYRFVHQALREAFGTEGLATLHRQTAAGPVEVDLETELRDMTALFDGAANVAARQLGMASLDNRAAGNLAAADAAGEKFLNWAASWRLDADLSQDARMMVPVYFDEQRMQTKVWVFLGWTTRDVYIDLAREPIVASFDKDGNRLAGVAEPEVVWRGLSKSLPYPVMAEVYVSRLLDRQEFRRHCDVYKTRSAILTNLQ